MITAGERRAARRWAAADLRQRWRSFVAVGLVFGATGAVTVAFVAGARQAETAYDRFHEAARGGDVLVEGVQAGAGGTDWSRIVTRPEVEAAAAVAGFGQRISVEGHEDVETDLLALAPAEPGGLYTSTEVPVLVEGRQADPSRDDEVVVDTVARRTLGIDVGDVLVLETQTVAADDPDNFDGPTIRLHVVGVGRIPLGYTSYPDQALAFVTAAVLRSHDEIAHGTALVVELRDPAADLPALREALQAEFDTVVPVVDLTEAGDRVRHGTTFEETGLLLLAAGVATVGLALSMQVLAGVVALDDRTMHTMRALGLTRAGRVVVVALPAVVAAAVALVVMVGGAVALSPFLPIGLARQLDPDVGVHVDLPVLAVVGLVVILLVAGSAAWGAWRAASDPGRSGAVAKRSVATLLEHLHLPVTAGIGARFALRAGSPGGFLLPPVVLVAVMGLFGALASAVVATGLDDAIAEPIRSGQHWDGFYFPDDPLALEQELQARDDVDAIARVSYASLSSKGTTFAAFSFEGVGEPASVTLATGRGPTGPDEVVLGVETAARLHLGPGDDLVVDGADGARTTLQVVGTGLLPQAVGSAFDEGAWLTPEGMASAGGLSLFGEASPAVAVAFDDTVPRSDIDVLQTADQGRYDNQMRAEAEVVTNLRSVRRLPLIEGAVFVLLALGSVALLLRSTSRRRHGELALLRVLGFTGRQTLAAVTWEGITVAVTALVLGVPLGIAAGRWVWQAMADSTSLTDVRPLPVAVLVAVVPVTLLATVVLAWVSAAGRSRYTLSSMDAEH